MAELTLELNANATLVEQPILWRLAKLYNVVPHILRARVTEDYGYMELQLTGSKPEIDLALNYLRELGMVEGKEAQPVSGDTIYPESEIPQPNAIDIRLKTVNIAQGKTPLLYRIGRDYNVVVTLRSAAFDEEEGGTLDITISGPLVDVQRSISFLHTTGLSVNPKQRSVSDGGNL